MSTTAEVVAELARNLARVLSDFADEVTTAASGPAAEEAIELPEARGERQQAILQLTELASEKGLKTSDIAAAIDYDVPNTYQTLQGLERSGLVEQIPDARPQRWRLGWKYRRTSPRIAQLASHVRPGEWTTYGDISIALRGDTKAARAVGRLAATVADFPNPHRILLEGGHIPEGWLDSEGRGPDECRRRLESEGVRFEGDHAGASHRVSWDEIRQRAETAA